MPSPLPLDSNVYEEKQRKVKQKIIDQNHFVVLCIKLCDSLWLKKQFINHKGHKENQLKVHKELQNQVLNKNHTSRYLAVKEFLYLRKQKLM